MMMMMMMMMMMIMTLMKLVNSATKFRHGMDKFYQPNSGLGSSRSLDEAIYTELLLPALLLCCFFTRSGRPVFPEAFARSCPQTRATASCACLAGIACTTSVWCARAGHHAAPLTGDCVTV